LAGFLVWILDAARRDVLCTRLALAMVRPLSMVEVRAEAEVATSPRLAFVVSFIMGKSVKDTTKKRGRPVTTGKGTQIGTRWQDNQLKQIDDWRRKQEDKPQRSEAIRRLVELGLKAKSTK
jgi:hypothetical protein